MEVEAYLHAFLTAALYGDMHSASFLTAFPEGKRPWVGPKGGMDAVRKRQISALCWESNPNSFSLVTIPSELQKFFTIVNEGTLF
jgi:hypothetical protein